MGDRDDENKERGRGEREDQEREGKIKHGVRDVRGGRGSRMKVKNV